MSACICLTTLLLSKIQKCFQSQHPSQALVGGQIVPVTPHCSIFLASSPWVALKAKAQPTVDTTVNTQSATMAVRHFIISHYGIRMLLIWWADSGTLPTWCGWKHRHASALKVTPHFATVRFHNASIPLTLDLQLMELRSQQLRLVVADSNCN